MARRVKVGRGDATTTSGAPEDKALAEVTTGGDDSGGGGFSAMLSMHSDDAERELSQEGALEAYHLSSALHIAVSPIVRAVGEVVYAWQDETEPSEFDLARPNRWHQSAEHFGLCAAYLALGGEYVAIKNQTGRGVELWPIPPYMIEDPEARSDNWQIEDGAIGGLSRTEFSRDELLIIQEPDLLDPYMHGRGAGQAIGSDIDIDDAAAEHTATYLENYARPDAILGADGVNPDELERFIASMNSKHSGPQNAGRLETIGADISVETLMQEFDKIGTPEIRRFSGEIARRVFGVPPSITGDASDTNRATAETEEFLFKKNVIKPLVDKIVEAHNSQFVTPDLGEQYKVVAGPIVPANTERRLEYAKEHPGAVYANESRQWLGLETKDELDDQTLADVQPSKAGTQQRGGRPDEGKGHDHSAQKKITPIHTKQDDRIDQILEVVQPDDMEGVKSEFERAMADWAEQTIEGIDGESLADVFGGGVLTEAVEAKVEERFAWVLDDLTETTRETLRRDIVEALDEGENPRRVAQRLRSTYDEDFTQWRSETIARTEMLSASNAGTWTAHKESDVVKWRSWLSTRDGNVRPAHVALDAQTAKNPIKVDQPFTYGGNSAMHPGNFGVARLDCSCRCTTVAEFKDKVRSEAEREKLWERYVKGLAEDERRAAEAVRADFRAQEERVMNAFADAFDVDLEAAA